MPRAPRRLRPGWPRGGRHLAYGVPRAGAGAAARVWLGGAGDAEVARKMPHGDAAVKGSEPGEPGPKKLKAAEGGSELPGRGAAASRRPQQAAGTPVRSGRPTPVPSVVWKIARPPPKPTDDGIYSTSKEFIGPLYQPPEKRKGNEKKNPAGTGRREKQKPSLKKAAIDSELSQFYKEIEELEQEKDDSEGACRAPGPADSRNSELLKSEGEERGGSHALQPPGAAEHCVESAPDKRPCNGQVMPSACDVSFASFSPEWPPVPPFIVPHGPPLPGFNYLNVQRLSAPPNLPSDIFCAQDSAPICNGYYESSFPVHWNSLTFEQDQEYADYGVHDGYFGFYETSAVHWEDPSTEEHYRTDRFLNQQFQEEKLNKLQKLLILLRGLPGSGKTTLSRILLGQSRDGIVFSTDDYFHHQDGYRYNVNQLGDAHDWNQNRAKQAINQGRSPVIIDNTNTQAWEMKPYVEMAIGKGYRVEFHEPETWWKFDPEELEKRNKHGVSRQKIAQMLERYEYEMSISIVMNSVEPSHKSTPRSPSQETEPSVCYT